MFSGMWFYYAMIAFFLVFLVHTITKLVRMKKSWQVPARLMPYIKDDKQTQKKMKRVEKGVHIFLIIVSAFFLTYFGRDLPAALQKDYLELSGEVVSCLEETPKKVQDRGVNVRDEQSGEIVQFYFSTRYIDAGTHIEVTYLPFTKYVVEARVYS